MSGRAGAPARADALFGAVREVDRWFAAHWSDLDEAESLRLNDKVVDMIAAMAAPSRMV